MNVRRARRSIWDRASWTGQNDASFVHLFLCMLAHYVYTLKGSAVSGVRLSHDLKIVLIAVFVGLTGTVLVRSIWFHPNASRTESQAKVEREVTVLLSQAENASDAGDITTADRLFDDVLQLDPGNQKALLYSAGIRQQSGARALPGVETSDRWRCKIKRKQESLINRY